LTDNVSKRYVLIFQKRRYVQKIFSMIFKCFKIYVQSNIFNDFFQCLFKKYVQRSFEIYVFLCTFKRIFHYFFCVNTYVKDLKNMYKLQSEKFFKFFSKVCAKCFSLIFQKHPKIFLLFTQKVFDIESGVPCKTEFIGCYYFLTNLIKLKHMPTKIITSFLFRDTTLIYAWTLRRRVSK